MLPNKVVISQVDWFAMRVLQDLLPQRYVPLDPFFLVVVLLVVGDYYLTGRMLIPCSQALAHPYFEA